MWIGNSVNEGSREVVTVMRGHGYPAMPLLPPFRLSPQLSCQKLPLSPLLRAWKLGWPRRRRSRFSKFIALKAVRPDKHEALALALKGRLTNNQERAFITPRGPSFQLGEPIRNEAFSYPKNEEEHWTSSSKCALLLALRPRPRSPTLLSSWRHHGFHVLHEFESSGGALVGYLNRKSLIPRNLFSGDSLPSAHSSALCAPSRALVLSLSG